MSTELAFDEYGCLVSTELAFGEYGCLVSTELAFGELWSCWDGCCGCKCGWIGG